MSENDERGDGERDDGGRGVGRTLALSDGIFAIAMTLVAFQIQVPLLSHKNVSQLAGKLGGLTDHYVSFFITFAVIGFLWLAHHRLFRYVERCDDALMLVNLLFLMVVAALPFPSAVLGDYASQRPAVLLYASSMSLAGILLTALTLVAHRRGLLFPGTPADSLRMSLWRSASTVIVFTLSIPVAIVAPTVTPYTWLVLIPMRMFNPIPKRRQRRREADVAS
jgi:uncharacterized membrane protein